MQLVKLKLGGFLLLEPREGLDVVGNKHSIYTDPTKSEFPLKTRVCRGWSKCNSTFLVSLADIYFEQKPDLYPTHP